MAVSGAPRIRSVSLVALLTAAAVAIASACAQGANPGLTASGDDAGVGSSQSGTDPSGFSDADAAPAPSATTPNDNTGGETSAGVPTLSSLAPNTATLGSIGPTIVLTGNNFVARTVVQLDGAPLTTTFVSSTELRATIPTASLSTLGTLQISVGTSPPGGGASTELPFTVQNPVPTLASLTPLSVQAGAGATPITLVGTNFVTDATVTVGGTPVTAALQDPQTITTTIPATLTALSGALDVVVTNPAPGGGASTAISFTVTNPSIALSTLSPNNAFVNSGATTIMLTGSGFVSASSVLFNGVGLTTTFTDTRTLSAVIPSAQLTTVGDFPVAVKSPPPGGGISTPLSFRVQYATPVISNAAPSTISVGAGATTVSLIGSGFYPTSQIMFNGVAAATTYTGATSLNAMLTAAQVAVAGPISVTVVTPAPGGGTSNTVSIAVNNPAPAITSISPAGLTVGSADTVITLTGTGYEPNSVVQLNAANLATTYVSATSLKATVPAAQMASPGSVNITVMTPAPGGGTSAPKSLTIGCDATGVTATLGAIGTPTTIATNFAGASTYTLIDGGFCPTTFESSSEPVRFWVVQNTTSASATLAAWAVCPDTTGQDDALLTFYAGSTIPMTETARAQCTNVIAEGIDGAAGNYASSNNTSGSNWCPGLTKANGGGLTLSVCQKAVVAIQPYSMTSTTYLPPPQIQIELQ